MNENKYVSQETSDQIQFFDWKDRPDFIKEKIKSTFLRLNNTKQEWGLYDGTENTYEICGGISEFKLIKQIIKDNPSQTEFWILDVGAARFGCIQYLFSLLNKDSDIPSHIKINLIGITGEKRDDVKEEGKVCTLYKLSNFQIENMIEEFKNRNLWLENKIDFAFSRWAFIHLVDPLGTFAQLYRLLNLTSEKSGFLAMDDFCFYRNNSGNEQEDLKDKTTIRRILLELKQPFLLTKRSSTLHKTRTKGDSGEFIMKRIDEEFKLPIRYSTEKKFISVIGSDIYSQVITCFDNLIPVNPSIEKMLKEKIPNSKRKKRYYWHGDEELYHFLNDNNIFSPCNIPPHYTPFSKYPSNDSTLLKFHFLSKQKNFEKELNWIEKFNELCRISNKLNLESCWGGSVDNSVFNFIKQIREILTAETSDNGKLEKILKLEADMKYLTFTSAWVSKEEGISIKNAFLAFLENNAYKFDNALATLDSLQPTQSIQNQF